MSPGFARNPLLADARLAHLEREVRKPLRLTVVSHLDANPLVVMLAPPGEEWTHAAEVFDACPGGEACTHGWAYRYQPTPRAQQTLWDYPVGWHPPDFIAGSDEDEDGWDAQGDPVHGQPHCSCGWPTDTMSFERDAERHDVIYCRNCRGYAIFTGDDAITAAYNEIDERGHTALHERLDKWAPPAEPVA